MAIAEIPKKQVKQDSPAEQIRKSKQRKAEFLERKRRVMRLEIDNTNKVIFFRQNNDYWHLGGVSALLYTYVVAKRYKRNARIIEDDTKDCKFPDGIVAVKTRTMLQMITMMVKDGAVVEEQDEKIVIVKMSEAFSKEALMTLKRAEKEQILALREKVIPDMIFPKTVEACEALSAKIGSMLNKEKAEDKKIIYHKIFKDVNNLLLVVVENSSKNTISLQDFIEKVQEKIDKITYQITVAMMSHKPNLDDSAKLVKMLGDLDVAFRTDIKEQKKYLKIKNDKLKSLDKKGYLGWKERTLLNLKKKLSRD